MPANYIDTPGTERDDVSIAQVPALDFSIIQPFMSPSKNATEDLRNRMRGRANAYQQRPTQTPRVRGALLSRPNPPTKQEFTPLLRSAKRKEMTGRAAFNQENVLADIPPTPAGFRSSYGGDATHLPMNSSMLDENTTSSIGAAVQNPVSSSMLSATPMPSLPRDGQVVVEQGNVLSLRDQEAKLDQVGKENFGLKLKIHFLEEALRKTGSEYHQATLKENAELKTERLTIEAENKRQRKRFLLMEQELEGYRQKWAEYQSGKSDTLASDKIHAAEIAKLQLVADESQRLAGKRLQDLEDLREQLEQAQQVEHDSEDVQELKDDIQDLQRALRDRDEQLDSKADELAALQHELAAAKTGTQEMQHMQDDIDDLEAELKEKDDELDAQAKKIGGLETRLRSNAADDASSELRLQITSLEAELKHKTDSIDKAVQSIAELKQKLHAAGSASQQELDEREQEIEELQVKLETVQAEHTAADRAKDDLLRNAQRELADKEGESKALQERLNTARGSWDAEAQQTDARLQEKQRLLRDCESRLADKEKIIAQRDDELVDLQRRLRAAESRQADAVQSQSSRIMTLTQQVSELQMSLDKKDEQALKSVVDKEKVIEARSAELKILQAKVHTLPSSDELKRKDDRIRELESANRQHEAAVREQKRQISSLEHQAMAIETPSRKDAMLKEQSARIQSLEKLQRTKDSEVNALEQELESLEKENLSLQQQANRVKDLETKIEDIEQERDGMARRAERLQERARNADKDHSIVGHQTDELGEKQARIELLEDQIDKLEAACQRHERQIRIDIEDLQRRHATDIAAAKQALEDEVVMLENALDEADAARDGASAQIAQLEQELQAARLAKTNGTPVRERDTLRTRLTTTQAECNSVKAQHDALVKILAERNSEIAELKARLSILEADLVAAQAEKTIADERQDLHEIVKKARIEVEELQLKLRAKDRKTSASGNELQGQLNNAQLELEDQQTHVAELEMRLVSQATREKQLRAQLAESKEALMQKAELEMQLSDRKSSSSGHARREAELRTQLRDAKIGLESMQQELAEKEDRLLTLMKREQALRKKLKRRDREPEQDTTQILVDELQAQLDNAEADIEALQQQLSRSEKALAASQKKSLDLKNKVKELRRNNTQDMLDEQQLVQERQHRREIKGLSKQIELLRARCSREEGFRKDLIYTKRWFLLQVEMSNECNQADLRLLEEMGITPDHTIRQKKPSLRTVGLTVLAAIRMQKRSEEWASKKKLQDDLVRKLQLVKQNKMMY